jgi:hypothetical protein
MRSQGLKGIQDFREFCVLWDATTHYEVRLGLLHYLAACGKYLEIGYIRVSLIEQIMFFLGVVRSCFTHHCDERKQDKGYSYSNFMLLEFAMLCLVQRVDSGMRKTMTSSIGDASEYEKLKEAVEETLTLLANPWLVNGFSSYKDPERRAVSSFLESYAISYKGMGLLLPDDWYKAVIIGGMFEIFDDHAPLEPKVVGFLHEWLTVESWFCHMQQSRDFVPFSDYFKVEGRRSLVTEREQQAAMTLLMHAARCGMLQSEQVQNLVSRQFV